jgi:hypothetical protein
MEAAVGHALAQLIHLIDSISRPHAVEKRRSYGSFSAHTTQVAATSKAWFDALPSRLSITGVPLNILDG